MNAWVQIPGCTVATPSPGPSGGSNLAMEAVTVTGLNTAAPLTLQTPDGLFFQLVINGTVFAPLGATPPFSIAGQQITWLSSTYGFNTSDTVVAFYSYGGG